tara:strand:- start:7098 stop:9095 length:1998 start_codon:yes stop_codon:yes gene_type:complete
MNGENTHMKQAILVRALLALLLAAPVSGERHKVWTQFGYDALIDGRAHGVSVTANGTLRPAAALDSFSTFNAERVWSLAEDETGTLYAATGDNGRIYAIDAQGNGTLLFDSPEISLHSLALDEEGTLYAGSAPDGIIYAIPAGGQPTVLAHTGSHYVWDLALDDQGRLHAVTGEPASVLRVAADGAIEKLFEPTDRHLMTMLFTDGALYASSAQKGRIYHIEKDRGRLLFEAVEEEINGLVRGYDGALYASAIGHENGDESDPVPSAIYRITPDGAAQRWWSDSHVLLRDIAPADEGLLVATDEGRVLHLDAQGHPGLLTQDENFRINHMLQTADGAIYLADAHSGQLRRLGTASAEGHYESRVEDFASHTRWGRVTWRGSGVQLATRSGNSPEPDATWSAWSATQRESGFIIRSPAARYVQYRVELEGNDAYLEHIALHGLRANLPPQIASLEIQPYRTQQRSSNQQQQQAPQQQRSGKATQTRSLYRLRWQASDPNGEKLLYDLYLRGEGQTQWKEAHRNEERTSLLWETATMPEGWTQIKLVASDRGENPPEEALSSEYVSPLFAIDNSPPSVEIDAHVKGRNVQVHIDVSDRISALKKVQYSIDYGDEEFTIAAADGVYDSRAERAQCTLSNLAVGEHVIAVQAWDALDNIGTQQIIIQID